MIDKARLLRCADWHDAHAALALAKAAEHHHAGERDDFLKQQARAEGHASYAEIIREAHAVITRKERARANPNAPTIEELLAFAKELGWPQPDAEAWFDHFNSNGWKVSGTTPMKDWRAAARNGFRRWKAAHQPAAKSAAVHADPEGWQTFLKSINRKPEEYRYVADWLKTEFIKWRRRQEK